LSPSRAASARLGIALLGPYGSGNLGDAAIQEAALQNLRRLRPNAWIFGIGGNSEDTLKRHGIECFPIEPSGSAHTAARVFVLGRLLQLLSEIRFTYSAWRLMVSTHLLVISGGGQIDDFWGGPWGHPFTVLRWTLLAKLAGARVAAVSIGADTLSSWASKLFFRTALRMSDYRSFRDKDTLRYVESELGVRGGCRWVPDLAFSLPTARPGNAKTGKREGPLVIGISPISHTAWTGADDPIYKRYLVALRELVSRLRGRGYRIRLFPSQVRMDTAPLRALLSADDAGPDDRGAVVTVKPVESLDEMLREVEACDIVVAARLHGVLLSVLMRKPVVAVSYSRKVRVLMEALGCPELCLDVDQVTLDELEAKLDDAIARRAEIAALENEKVTEWVEMLDRQYLDILALLD